MAEYEPPEQKRDFKVAQVGSGVKAMMAGFAKWACERVQYQTFFIRTWHFYECAVMTTHDEAERGVHILHSLDDLTTLLQIYLPRARLNIV